MAITMRQGSSSAATTLVVLMSALLLAEYAAALTINVGGSSGWGAGVDYKAWAAGTRVKPNDALFFKYIAGQHNVLQVSKADYDACKTTAPWRKLTSGADTVKFTNSGTYYFICGFPNHCASGIKVAVTVKW